MTCSMIKQCRNARLAMSIMINMPLAHAQDTFNQTQNVIQRPVIQKAVHRIAIAATVEPQ